MISIRVSAVQGTIAVLAAWLAGAPGIARAQETTLPANRDEVIHVLNRTSFGIRPGQVEAVQKMGLNAYLQSQLHPELIDDSATDQAVAQLPMMQLTEGDLSQMYQDERKKKQQKRLAQAQAQNPVQAQPAGTPPAAATPMVNGAVAPGANETVQEPPQPTLPADPTARRAALMQLIQDNKSIMAITQLEQAKLVREVDSKRQLQEVLVDFWTNHFNVDVKKGEVRVYAVSYDRDTIRPHIWGSFRELLEATTKSPAMLFYLDNATNTAPREMTPQMQQRIAQYMQQNLGIAPAANPNGKLKAKKQGGINENYAREVMELHTLGVDGGYTQKDVQEVARCFTGWSIERQTGQFIFRPFAHDNGEKVVLGHTIPAGGGMKDGEMVLDILCSSPACAHFIAKEMCQRFVSDDPPEALVTRVAGVFTSTHGDLRSVTQSILTSPEFLSPSTFGNKIKSPVEFAVSAVRASESSIVPAEQPPFNQIRGAAEASAILGRARAADRISGAKRQSLNWHIAELGEPLYACTPPTGYKEVSKTWVSPGALIERLNLSLALTEQNVSDVRFGTQNILAGVDLDKPDAVLNQCVSVLLQNNITDSTRKVLTQAAVPAPGSGQTVNPSKLIALILGSPEFQRK